MKTGYYFLLLILFSGCISTRKPPAIDLSAAGWKVRHAQVVWKPRKEAPELAGELLLAERGPNETFISFSKTMPIMDAQTDEKGWHIFSAPENKSFGARGKPTTRIGWFQVWRALQGQPVDRPWKAELKNDGSCLLENTRTGEQIEIFPDPPAR